MPFLFLLNARSVVNEARECRNTNYILPLAGSFEVQDFSLPVLNSYGRLLCVVATVHPRTVSLLDEIISVSSGENK